MSSILRQCATLTTVCVAVSALAAAAGATNQPHLITDPSVIARHRALGQLGEPTVTIDRALIARHRALAALPTALVTGHAAVSARQSADAALAWRKPGAIAAAALIVGLAGFVLRRRGRRVHRTS